MIKSILFSLLKTAALWQLFFPMHALVFSQISDKNFTVHYKLFINNTPGLESAAELQYSEGLSVFYWHDNEQESQMDSDPGRLTLHLRDSDPVGTINTLYFDENLMTTRGSLFNEPYLLKEPLPNLTWKLGSGTKRLGGILLQQATTSFRGRNYTAWYAPEMPYPIGPWKLHGLPGIILEAYDEEGFFQATFTGLFEGEGPVLPPNLNFLPAKELDLETYQQRQESMAEELVQRIRAKLPRGTRLSVQDTKADFLERFF
jgi:GLPGLI family protein